MLTFHGPWRITVVSTAAEFEQRAVVRGLWGTSRVVSGRPEAWLDVNEDSWVLSLEHKLWGRSWQPNLRTTVGPVTESDGIRSRTVSSRDCILPGETSEDFPNLILRLEQALPEVPAKADHAESALRFASARTVPTSAVAGLAAVAAVDDRRASPAGFGLRRTAGRYREAAPTW
ncbi:hypothetical protein KNE206_69700 [Kitasatospora sp. NE20-6]|uniref:hypothetical protein n=1 Tax=Kitasatospora sp. NE20-6 TaxID=2859066 RepID=UPI0034DBBEC5